jgi:para-nitrobenzyl esterase
MKSKRRDFIKSLGTSVAGLSIASPLVVSSEPLSTSSTDDDLLANDDDQILKVGDTIAVAQTTNGKVRGFVLRNISTFRGIPYGADTSGKNRFMPPQKPEPWTEIRPTLWWGNSAPQNMDNRYADQYTAFSDHWNYDDVSEDCLRINVWTPSLTDSKKRPVMFWIHGGGFTNGNSIEQDGYNGENLSRSADIVFCSVNHRLGPLGFTNLAGVGGSKYAASGNVGMLDLVAALEWVRDNISNFGGDPSNVTIMGQSGGGAKVCTLTAMPSAKGLFHKAVVLSGASLRSGEKEPSEKLGSYVLREAGLYASDIDKLQTLTWKEYLALASKAVTRYRQESGTMTGGGFSPFVDGTIIPQHPYFQVAAPTAAFVPMIICSTFNEQSPSRFDSKLESISLDEVKKRVRERAGFGAGFGDKSNEVVDSYVKAFPDKKPIEIWSLISSNRKNAVTLANVKSKQTAPVYIAWFGFQPPLFDNRMRAFHCVDICFWFNNTDLMYTHTGGGSKPRKLAAKMSSALVQFMKTGNPNGGGLPQWPKYTEDKGETMVLDNAPVVKNDPDREARKALPI